MNPKFIDWNFNHIKNEDGNEYIWIEYYFQEQEGKLVRKSPVYNKPSGYFLYLLEDACRVAQQLIEGKKWEEVNQQFPES